MAFKFFLLALSISSTILLSPVAGQITAPCTPSMITTFSPCMNFVTNSSLNGTTPPSACCNSLNSLMTNGKDCLCLIATGSIPFQIPINRTLAISLPQSCKMPGVPLNCKAAGAPAPAPAAAAAAAPAPGIAADPTSTPSPELAPPEPLSPQSPPVSDAAPTPPAAATNGGASTSNTGSRTGVATSSEAQPSYGVSYMHLVMALLGAIALKGY